MAPIVKKNFNSPYTSLSSTLLRMVLLELAQKEATVSQSEHCPASSGK